MTRALITILAGGVGTRLWPLSRSSHPKQFFDIMDCGFSLLQTTIKRAIKLNNGILPVIIGNFEHRFIISEQLRQINATDCRIILEPDRKSTMSVAIIAGLEGLKYGFKTTAFFPSDHVITDEEKFEKHFREASAIATESKKIVTFGIKPTSPNTGYGYIEKMHNSNDIASFKEKPDCEEAMRYLQSGNFLWNSGIFVFDIDTLLAEARDFEYNLYENAKLAYDNATTEYKYFLLNKDYFNKIIPVSIDHGIMERTKKSVVISCEDFGWSDVGEFKAVYDLQNKDIDGNVAFDKNIFLHNTRDSCIINKTGSAVVVNDMQNALIVATQDATMVASLQSSQSVKDLVTKLEKLDLKQVSQNYFEYRPWGRYDNLLETKLFKVKQITVLPEKQLSLQLHYKRSEHWVIISGFAEVQIGEDILNLTADQSVYIPVQVKHRVKNTSKTEDLVFVEVQCGSYFGEDDIVRFEDNFGRV